MTLEDEHGVVDTLAVAPLEDAELLLSMRGIVGGVDVQQDLAAADLLATEAQELIEQGIVQPHQIPSARHILPTAERGLGAERFSQLLIGDDSAKCGIITQTVGVVHVFVAGHDLIDALSQELQRIMAHPRGTMLILRTASACLQ